MLKDKDLVPDSRTRSKTRNYYVVHLCVLLDLAGFLPAADFYEQCGSLYDTAGAEYVS